LQDLGPYTAVPGTIELFEVALNLSRCKLCGGRKRRKTELATLYPSIQHVILRHGGYDSQYKAVTVNESHKTSNK